MTKIEGQIIENLKEQLEENPNISKKDAAKVLELVLEKNKEGAKVTLKALEEYLEFDKSM